jgi:hypothetical protein
MRKNILRILLLSSLSAVLLLAGCSQEEAPAVSTPEDSAHVTEEEAEETTEETAEEGAEEATTEDDVVVYDPDKESMVYEEYKLSLFAGYSVIDAKDYLRENIKYLSVEKADQAVLDLEQRLKENQNYYINQVMDEDIQNAILVAYNLEENTFSMDDFHNEDYKDLVQTIIDNGYKFFPEEGLFYPIVDYRQLQIYDKFTSDEIRSYLAIFAIDSDAPSTSDAHLNIMLEDLESRLLMTEEHLRAYPEGQTFDTVFDAYEMYMHFYTVSMAYMGGFDPETRKMSDDLKNSYENFVKENPTSTTAAILNEYLVILRDHDYHVDNHVLNFLQDIKDVVVKHIGEITVK